MNLQLLNAAEEMVFYSEKFAPGSSEALGKAVSYGLPFSLYGFAVVFGVLAVIMFVVIIFGKIFGAKQEKSADAPKKVEKKAEPKVESTPVIKTVPTVDNGGIVAAIMAAISAFRSTNGENGGFRVVSFKKRK